LCIANSSFHRADYNFYVYMHCNFICGLSDVTLNAFSQSIGLHKSVLSY